MQLSNYFRFLEISIPRLGFFISLRSNKIAIKLGTVAIGPITGGIPNNFCINYRLEKSSGAYNSIVDYFSPNKWTVALSP